MFHIVTVHWRDDRWIDVQLSALARHIHEPFKVYAFLNDVPGDHRGKFHHVSTEPIKDHATKLNLLADMACLHATDERDVLIFLDGDAFPIADLSAFARDVLPGHRLAAVQRLENDGDCQPHPCFCITTIGFWRELRGDWKSGHTWPNRRGERITDVGGNLLKLLEDRGAAWRPLLRSNRTDLHPVWFAIYDDIIYHHGAGFRETASRLDYHRHARPWEWALIRLFWKAPRRGPLRRLRDKWNFMHRIVRRRFVAENQRLAQSVFQKIQRDPEFYREFQREKAHV